MKKLYSLMILVLVVAMLPLAATAQKPPSAVDLVGGAEPAAPGAAVAVAAPEALLYDNGPLVTLPGACSGQDASRLQTDLGMNTLGFGHQFTLGYRMADDFVVSDPGGWNVDNIQFFAYQSSAPSNPSPITGVYYQIWNGSPDNPNSSVIFGDLVTNRLVNSTYSNIQRDSGTSPCANNRYIFEDTASAGVTLPPGTYWLDWATDGSTAYSGPWAPPITIVGQLTTGNGLQYTTAWAAALDTGTSTQQGLPFRILGTIGGGGGDPDIDVSPTSLSAEQCQDTVTQQTLTICNVGGEDLTWSLGEGAFAGSMPFVPAKVSEGGVNAAISASAPAGALVAPEGSANPQAVLWDQPLSSVNQNAYVDQEFTDYPTYSAFLADDFVNGEAWNISTIYVPGDGWNGFSSLFNANSLTWQIYADNGGVPAGDPSSGGAVWTLTLAPTDAQVTITNGSSGYPSNTTLNLAAPVSVPAGHWWLVFYPTGAFSGFGQFGRQPADTLNGYVGQFINPGNAFGYGTAWVPWTVLGLTEQDIAFRLEGEGGPPDPLPWLSEDPTGGTIPAGGCVDVTVTFDSTGLAVGSYFGDLLIDSNDPDEPQVVVPVQMDVVDCNAYPDIEVTPASLSAEQCPDTVTQQTLSVCNVGTADLTWTLTEAAPKRGVTASRAPKVALPEGAPQSLTEWLALGKPAFQVQPVAPNVTAAPEALTFYTSRGTFDGDYPGLPVEGFENGSMPYGSVDAVPHPLDQYSSNAYFDPGDILPGIAFWGGADYADDEIAVLGEQFYGNPTKTAVSNYFTEPYKIVFDPPVQAVGMDLQELMGSYSCQVDVYDTNGYLTSVTSACNEAGVFWGVASDANPITQLVINSLGGGAEGADNIAFGGEAFDIPWLSEYPTSGTVPGGTCQDVTVTFDSTGLTAGDYFANLVIDSNDPDEPTVTVPVLLEVVECGADTMHIGDIVFAQALDPYGRVVVRWYVLTHDTAHNPLGEVAIDASIWSPGGGPFVRTRVTKFNGWARFHWGYANPGTFLLCVDNLTKDGYTYVPGDNDVPNCAP